MTETLEKLIQYKKDLNAWYDLILKRPCQDETLKFAPSVPHYVGINSKRYDYGRGRSVDAPKDFYEAVRVVMEKDAGEIVAKTYCQEINRLNSEIADERQRIMSVLESLDNMEHS